MNLNVSVNDALAEFVKNKVKSGLYPSESAVVSEALILLERQEALQNMNVGSLEKQEKLAWLRQAWQEGEASGDFSPLDIEAIKALGRKKLTEKI